MTILRDDINRWRFYRAKPVVNSQLKNVTVLRPVPSYTAWWQKHKGVNNLPKVVTQLVMVGIEPTTYWSQAQHLTAVPLCHLILMMKIITNLVMFVNNPRLKSTVQNWCCNASQQTSNHQNTKIVEMLKKNATKSAPEHAVNINDKTSYCYWH